MFCPAQHTALSEQSPVKMILSDPTCSSLQVPQSKLLASSLSYSFHLPTGPS